MPKRTTTKSKTPRKQAYKSKQLRLAAANRETNTWLNELPAPDPDSPLVSMTHFNQFEALYGVPTPVLHHRVRVPGVLLLNNAYAEISEQAIDILSERLIRLVVQTHIEVPGHVINLQFVPSVMVNVDGKLQITKSLLYDHVDEPTQGTERKASSQRNTHKLRRQSHRTPRRVKLRRAINQFMNTANPARRKF